MNRRDFLKLSALTAGACVMGDSLAEAAETMTTKTKKTPNLLFIYPDQYRLYSMGFWRKPEYRNALPTASDPVVTPTIDKLADESVVFTQAYSCFPVCSPYRAMFLSGAYPSVNQVPINCYKGRTSGLTHDVKCFTDVLFEEGYETAYIGKTHWERTEPLFDKDGNYVGTRETPGGNYVNPYDTFIPAGPGRHGNRYWFQVLRDNHMDPYAYSNDPALVEGKKDGELYRPRRFSTTMEADAIVDYLKNNRNQRDASKPFSLIWSINPPHSPYEKLSDCEESVYREHYMNLSNDEVLNRPNVAPVTGKNPKDPKVCAPYYYSNVTSVDRETGRVLQALEESGEADNTIVVFTSDHGDLMGSHGLMAKSQIYNECFLVPFLLRFPGRAKHRVDDLKLSPVDLMPTLLGMMGLGDKIPSSVSGTDFSNGILTGDYSQSPKPEGAFFFNEKSRGIRTDRYTYSVVNTGDTLLFDNKTDPYQMKNLPLDSIPAEDLSHLQQLLGNALKIAADPWFKDRKRSDLIRYPKA